MPSRAADQGRATDSPPTPTTRSSKIFCLPCYRKWVLDPLACYTLRFWPLPFLAPLFWGESHRRATYMPGPFLRMGRSGPRPLHRTTRDAVKRMIIPSHARQCPVAIAVVHCCLLNAVYSEMKRRDEARTGPGNHLYMISGHPFPDDSFFCSKACPIHTEKSHSLRLCHFHIHISESPEVASLFDVDVAV